MDILERRIPGEPARRDLGRQGLQPANELGLLDGRDQPGARQPVHVRDRAPPGVVSRPPYRACPTRRKSYLVVPTTLTAPVHDHREWWARSPRRAAPPLYCNILQ